MKAVKPPASTGTEPPDEKQASPVSMTDRNLRICNCNAKG